MRKEAEAVLKDRWGYAGFRPGQWEIIESVLEGRDTLAVLPTGGGKSICYQLPALMQEGCALVVSPLIALMQDQVDALNARGIPAAYINSTLRHYEIDRRWTNAEFGQYRFLYVAPERLQTEMFIARAERLPISLMAIDEAHCVSEWGHHFRPSYLELAEARERLGGPAMVAVTATATPEVRRDIITQLAFDDPAVIVRGFDRPNIIWSAFQEENKPAKVLEVCEGVKGTGLIYTATRRQSEEWARRLTREGISAGAYHAGLSNERREEVQQLWMEGGLRVVAATNAFGMGIDKPDVRFVIHIALPGSVEAYYQEAGRAGRDGDPSHAVLLAQPDDERIQRSLIDESHPDKKTIRAVYDAICNLAQLPVGSEAGGPLAIDRKDLMRLTELSFSTVGMALELLERQEHLQRMPVRDGCVLIRVEARDGLRRYAAGLENRRLTQFVESLHRAFPREALDSWWEADLARLSRRLEIPRERLVRGLNFLQERGLLEWRSSDLAMQVWLGGPRVRRPAIDSRAVKQAERRASKRLDYMLRYAQIRTCRRQFLLSYFGEEHPGACGACDVCKGRHQPAVITPDDEQLLRHVLDRVGEGASRNEWFETSPPAPRVQAMVDWLLTEDFLRVERPLEGTFRLTEKAVRWSEGRKD